MELRVGRRIVHNDKVYEYILFRGSDIKDLHVKSSPPVQIDLQLHNDPALIQSHFAGVPLSPCPSASIDGATSTDSTRWRDALANRVYVIALPTHQFAFQVDPSNSSNHSQAAQNAGTPLFSSSLHWHGYSGTTLDVSQAQQNPIPLHSSSMLSPMTVQSHVNSLDLHSYPIMGSINASEPANPDLSSITSGSLHSTVTASFTPVQCSMSHDMPPCSFMKAPASHAAYASLSVSSFPSSFEGTNINESPRVGNRAAAGDPSSVFPIPIAYPACSSGFLQTPSPSLVTPGQLAQARSNMLSSTQNAYPDHKDTTAFVSLSFYTPSVNSTPVTQPPLLPLPTPAQESLCSATRFTEEFDFEAMNKKFKKDEVRGYLRKANQNQGLSLLFKCDPKPAYTKDDFFDIISCNSHSAARNGQNRFSERMKLDSGTFGNFQLRSHVSYGPFSGYGSGHGQNYRVSYNWGSGFGDGGRDCGNKYF